MMASPICSKSSIKQHYRFPIHKAARIFIPLAAFCAFLFFAFPSESAWTREEGKFFLADTIDVFKSRHYYHPDGNKERNAPIPVYSKQEYTRYVEYGWTEDITIGGKASLAHVSSLEGETIHGLGYYKGDEQHNWGIAQPEIFLRAALTRFSIGDVHGVISAQPKLKLPSLFLDGQPRTDTEDIDGEFRLLMGAGTQLNDKHHFIVLEAAYRHRTGALHDQWLYDVTMGREISPRLTALTQLFLVRSADLPATSPSMALYTQDYESDKVQLSLVYRLTEHIHFQAGGYMHLNPHNTGAGKGAIFSLWREF